MDIPAPKSAQMIRYSYLWADEHAAGREEGIKDRPVAIVLALAVAGDETKVAVVPVTHAPPSTGRDAIEIPTTIKQHLGLDHQASWILLDEMNVFLWPGPDLRPTGRPGQDTVLFGYLPSGFFQTVRDRVTANVRAAKLRQVPRTE